MAYNLYLFCWRLFRSQLQFTSNMSMDAGKVWQEHKRSWGFAKGKTTISFKSIFFRTLFPKILKRCQIVGKFLFFKNRGHAPDSIYLGLSGGTMAKLTKNMKIRTALYSSLVLNILAWEKLVFLTRNLDMKIVRKKMWEARGILIIITDAVSFLCKCYV